MSLKQIANVLINESLLKPFGLKLSFRTGSNPIEDMVSLLRGHPASVIVDGGAYEGSFSREIAKVFPGTQIHAFEPTPASYSLLEQNTRTIPAVTRHRLALGSKGGTATLFVNASPLTNSLRKSTLSGHRYFSAFVANLEASEVQVAALADFAHDNAVEAIDILKLDLQGNELEAIVGLGKLVETVKIIYAEVQFVELYEGAPLFSEIEAYLRNRGLAFYQFYDLVRSPNDGRLLYGDAMFVRAEIIPGL